MTLVKSPMKEALPPLVDYPRKKKPIEELIELLGGKTDPNKDMSLLASLGFDDVWEAAGLVSEAMAAVRSARESARVGVACRHEGPDVRAA